MADSVFQPLMLVCALSIFAIVALVDSELALKAEPRSTSGLIFLSRGVGSGSGDFGRLPFIFGTLVSSLLALVMAVPLALGVAIFLTELCPGARGQSPS